MTVSRAFRWMSAATRLGCSAAVYPLMVGGALGGSIAALQGGVPATIVVIAGAGLALALTALLERLLPFRDDWLRSRGDVLTDGWHLVLSISVAGELGRQLALLCGSLLGGWGALWPSSWPLWAQVPLALAIAELGPYWLHRLQHQGGWLWRIHAIHHTPERLYFLNASRSHALDSALTALLAVAPLAALGAGSELLAVFTVVVGVHSALQHSNVDLRLGPLGALLSAAEVHRWHHSQVLSESCANYGQVVLLWDLVFGTWRRPGPGRVEVGLDPEHRTLPGDWLGQTLAPWNARYWRSR